LSRLRSWTALVVAGCALLAANAPAAGAASGSAAATATATATATPIKHFIYLMQGARSFDDYFGTYPGAAGFPAGECQKTGAGSDCVRPYSLDGQSAGLSGIDSSLVATQVDGGKMDHFVSAFAQQDRSGQAAMGYYNGSELPTDWAAADQYVLFDQFYSDAEYGTTANRADWVAAADPGGDRVPTGGYGDLTTIFDRLEAAGVSWTFYVQDYSPKNTGLGTGASKNTDDQAARVPLLDYARFLDDPKLRGHIEDLSQYYVDLADGTLPAVSYVASSGGDEQAAHSIAAGQRLIQTMVNQLMVSRYWDSSAFLWSYDQSGGWFDQAAPPQTAAGTLGLRVPAVLVSAYAKQGSIDATLSDPESALRFIEQNWGLAPLTNRDADANSLAGAFDFAAGPRPARLLPGPVTASATVATAADPRTGHAVALYAVLVAGCVILLAVAAATALRRSRSLADPEVRS